MRSSRQAEHLAFARTERANIDAALAWSATHDPLLALGIVNGFGWAWVVLGDSRGAQRILSALDAVGDARPDPGPSHVPCCSPPGSKPRPTTSSSPVTTSARRPNWPTGRRRRPASAVLATTSPTSCRTTGEFRRALELTDRSDALYDGMDRDWDQAANWLFAARAAISAGDQERSIEARDQVEHWLQTVDDPWLHVRYEAMLGELARIQHRFDDAVVHIGRAAETSRRLGFQQTEAYQTASLGRAQCQAGDYDTGAATLELAIDKAEATGDVRMAALARVHLGRVLRALGAGRTSAGSAPSGDCVAPRRRRRGAGRTGRVSARRHGRP